MSIEIIEVQIPFAGIEAIDVEIVNSVGQQGPPGALIPSETAPENPADGDQWLESGTWIVSVWSADENAWVGTTGPAGANGATVAEVISEIESGGETLNVNYFTVADQTGFTIPDNTFGRKGIVPYFGNTPITDGQSIQIAEQVVSTGSAVDLPLATFSVPAAAVAPGQSMRFSADLYFQFSAANADAWLLRIDSGTGTVIEGGIILQLGQAQLQSVRIEGQIKWEASGAGVILEINGLKGMLVNSAVGGSKTATLTGKVFENGVELIQSTQFVETSGAANSIKLFLTDYSATASQSANVIGRATVSLL